MKCGYCGKTIRDSATFCRHCGHRLDVPLSEGEEAPPARSHYLSALLTLMIILAALTAGGLRLVMPVMPVAPAASPSDLPLPGSSEPPAEYRALVGKWKCTDPAAAGYTASDYGVEVSIVLTVKEDGSCGLHYRMTDTGVKAVQLDLTGRFSADRQSVTFRPDLSPLEGQSAGRYFLRNGSELPFDYAVSGDMLTLTGRDGIQTRWSRVTSK